MVVERGRCCHHDRPPPGNLYNNTRMRAQMSRILSLNIMCIALCPYIESIRHFPIEGWSSDFAPLPSAFSSKCSMAFLLRSHNGVHCCGTVGDSHPSSQLIAAKRTFMGDSFSESRCKDMNIFSNYQAFLRKLYLFLKMNTHFAAYET